MKEKRVATGAQWKDKFLQVYPQQKIFASEAEWRTEIFKTAVADIHFETKEEKPSLKNETVTPSPSKKAVDEEDWVCGYCKLPSGNDHRMCIVNGYKYNVKDWENDRTYSSEKKVVPKKEAIDTAWCYNDKSSAVLPPGEYYIGDLCYALKDHLYDSVFGPTYASGHYWTFRPNETFMMAGTGGDGTFRGSDGKRFEVDAGIIGIASLSTLDPAKAPYYGGHMYKFSSPVHVKMPREGNFSFYGESRNDPHLKITIYEDDNGDYDSE